MPDKIFSNVALITKELRRNPKFRVFKVGGEIYLAPVDCLKSKNEDSFDGLDNVAISDRGREEKATEDALKEERDWKQAYSPAASSYYSSNRNKYFVQIEGGSASVGSKGQVLPDYTLLDGSSDGINISFDKKANDSKYKIKSSFGLTFGSIFAENSYLSFKIKRISGSKTDSVPFTASDVATGDPLGTGVTDFGYTDDMTNIYIGGKFLFLKDSSFKPSLSVYLGVSMVDGKLSLAGSAMKPIEYSATDIAAIVEGGVEYFLSSHFSLGVFFGYEHLGQKNFKIKDDSGNLTKDSLKSVLNYSNTYGDVGLAYYF